MLQFAKAAKQLAAHWQPRIAAAAVKSDGNASESQQDQQVPGIVRAQGRVRVGLVLLQLHTAVQQLDELFAACDAVTKHVSLRLQLGAFGVTASAPGSKDAQHGFEGCGNNIDKKAAKEERMEDVEVGQQQKDAASLAQKGYGVTDAGDGKEPYEGVVRESATCRNNVWQQPDVSLKRCLSREYAGTLTPDTV